MRLLSIALIAITAVCPLATAEDDDAPDTGGGAAAGPVNDWSVPVPGWKQPAPGEHPRLFFRKSDLPAIRKRAETAEGKRIVERLRLLVGGGETMPTLFSTSKKAYSGKAPKGPPGAVFTLWHAAGFGMLYQLTGDKKYAEFGKQCVDRMLFDAVRDKDDRYALINPGGALRTGPSLGALAMAYDLNYDGWDEAYRSKIAGHVAGLRSKPEKDFNDTEYVALGKRHGPHSNHWGPQIGGGALALLAVRGDAGVDQAYVERTLAGNRACYIRQLVEGFGETGYFKEHPGAGQIASDTAFVPGLQAWYVAGGRDFYSPRTHARYLTLRWTSWLLKPDGKTAWYLNPAPGGSYGTERFTRGPTVSRSGQFAQGFFGLTPAEQAATLWMYQNFVEPEEQATYGKEWQLDGKPSFDALEYPHRAILALVNWPIGVEPKNPQGIIPNTIGDRQMGLYIFRNRWKDADDILLGVLLGARGDGQQTSELWGHGQKRLRFGQFPDGKFAQADHYVGYADGSGVVTSSQTSLAIDFSGNADAKIDAVLVMLGPCAPGVPGGKKGKPNPGVTDNATMKQYALTVDGVAGAALVMSKAGTFIEPKVDGKVVTVGGQTFTWDGKNLAIGKNAGAWKGPLQTNP